MSMNDDALVERLKIGDDTAFEALYERHATSLLRHLFCLMGNQQEAEEMLHESLMLMIQKINFYVPRSELKNSFKSWLFRLSTNRAIDEIRKRKAGQELINDNLEMESPIQDEMYEVKEKELIISDMLLKLPLMQRMVLSLRVLDDLSYTEISAICGRDVNTVKQGLFHARKAMKNLLMEQGELV
jgi:RNA polymerase sigma-70 factor (ECF subfamily)